MIKYPQKGENQYKPYPSKCGKLYRLQNYTPRVVFKEDLFQNIVSLIK